MYTHKISVNVGEDVEMANLNPQVHAHRVLCVDWTDSLIYK